MAEAPDARSFCGCPSPPANQGEDAPVLQDARNRIVKLYEAWGKQEEAERWRGRLKKKAS